MRKKSGKSSLVPWLGGGAIGLSLGASFYAGHLLSVNPAQPTTGATQIAAPKLAAGQGMAIGENTIADIAASANLSVVNIDTQSSIMISDYPFFGGPMGGLEFFFGQGMQPMPRKLEQRASGSGVIYRQDGYILTNNHVVGHAQNIKVTLCDKRTFDGKVVGRDKFTDLAIVKINATGLPAATLGSSKKLRPGDWVIAIGSPMGLDHTVTLGIVSALNRSLSEVNQLQLIQTDAAINHGNSGGPLLNIHGEVIGINTAIRPDAQNIGFAIPVDIAKDVAEQLVQHGNIAHAYVGIQMQDLDEHLAKSLGLSTSTKGVVVARTVPGGPADAAGLQQGDVIVKIDGQQVLSGKEVQDIVHKHKPNDTLNFLVSRNGSLTAIPVKIGDFPSQDDQQQ